MLLLHEIFIAKFNAQFFFLLFSSCPEFLSVISVWQNELIAVSIMCMFFFI